ncbi:hypothetical protein HZS55_15665 [Halosimplex rubrum]|uniref:RelE toxin-related domain-containing protein n=1 Tax=Halosimplex rubrum TaxID=869889 RepID=A0A7D5P1W6_9EURY|nr:hypothetical protein [Halosimplex rubrum]QLH78637.1 hypothetical protein HZS55_15665 [Halosimplex rubrum]
MATVNQQSGICWVSGHARDRWRNRTHARLDDLKTAWYEATPVEYPPAKGETYARYHAPTDTVLLARNGELVTVIELTDRPADQQEFVRDQAEAPNA